MFGVKLTVLGVVLLIITVVIFKITVNASGYATKCRIMINDFPKWFNVFSFILFGIGVLDIIGIIYSVIWLLFFK